MSIIFSNELSSSLNDFDVKLQLNIFNQVKSLHTEGQIIDRWINSIRVRVFLSVFKIDIVFEILFVDLV